MTLTLIDGGRSDYSKMTVTQLMERLCEQVAEEDKRPKRRATPEERAERRVELARYTLIGAREELRQLRKRLYRKRAKLRLKAVK